MKVRKVGKDILFDYVGMNPATAKIFGFKDIAEDEILVRDNLSDAEAEKTAKHEVSENDDINSGMDYWPAHTKALSQEKSGGDSMVTKSTANLIRKTITCKAKEVADRVLEFVGSLETPDRYGDIVHADTWKLDNYVKNPVFLWAHDYTQPPIGKAVKVWVDEGKLMFHIMFADKDTYPFADTIYRLYKGNFLNAVSVGFDPSAGEMKTIDGAGIDYSGQELLELSGCPIPAHPDALTTARANGLITAKDFEAIVTKTEVVEKHKEHEISQAELADDMDYLLTEIQSVGISDSNKEVATKLLDELRRLTDSDKSVDIAGEKEKEEKLPIEEILNKFTWRKP